MEKQSNQIGFQDQLSLNVGHSALLSTFIKLLFFLMIFVLSIFEWPLYTGFTDNKDLEQVGEIILYISYMSLISFGFPL